jgi:hypothetical protein
MHPDFLDTVANNEDPLGVHGDFLEPTLDPVAEFYNDDDTIHPNFLEGPPVIVTREGETCYHENTQDDATPRSGSPLHSVTLRYPNAGSTFYYGPTKDDMSAIEEHDRLRERGDSPDYLYHPVTGKART